MLSSLVKLIQYRFIVIWHSTLPILIAVILWQWFLRLSISCRILLRGRLKFWGSWGLAHAIFASRRRCRLIRRVGWSKSFDIIREESIAKLDFVLGKIIIQWKIVFLIDWATNIASILMWLFLIGLISSSFLLFFSVLNNTFIFRKWNWFFVNLV